jgi:hypothetical protein
MGAPEQGANQILSPDLMAAAAFSTETSLLLYICFQSIVLSSIPSATGDIPIRASS